MTHKQPETHFRIRSCTSEALCLKRGFREQIGKCRSEAAGLDPVSQRGSDGLETLGRGNCVRAAKGAAVGFCLEQGRVSVLITAV